MCEANAYVVKDGKETLVLEAVDLVEPEDTHSWRLINIFGHQKMIKGRIKTMNLVHHRIIFEELSE